jgi:hypothetical protein
MAAEAVRARVRERRMERRTILTAALLLLLLQKVDRLS